MSQCRIEAARGERGLACIGWDLENMSALRTQTGTRRGENRRIAGQGNANHIYVCVDRAYQSCLNKESVSGGEPFRPVQGSRFLPSPTDSVAEPVQ